MRALLLVAWRNALASRGRTAMSLLAIAVGVAFLSSSLAVSDTLSRNVSALFSSQYETVDVVVRGEALAFGLRADLDDTLVAEVAAVPGVAVASGVVEGFAQPIGTDGEPVGSGQQPGLGRTWIDDERLQSLPLVDGRAPAVFGEVALDTATADRGGITVGDPLVMATTTDAVDVTVVGLVDLSSGTGSPLSWYDPQSAQRLLGTPGKVQEIFVAAEPDVSPESLVSSVSRVLPAGAEALTGAKAAEQSQQAVSSAFGFFQVIMLVFVGIGLVVCAFIVFNTFSVLTAQRSRQLAMLRAIGTSRTQVMSATLAEGIVLGVVGSLIGLVLGYLGTSLLVRLIAALGVGDLSGGLVLRPATIAISLAAGLIVTVLGAYPPARRAGRTPPISAIRATAVAPPPVKFSWLMVGAFSLPMSVLVISWGANAGYPDGMDTLGAGILLLLVALLTLGRPIIVGVVHGLARPIARTGSFVGGLAGRNAVRDPRRTVITAGSLALGLALVSTLSVLASSTKATLDDAADNSLTADLVVLPLVGVTPMPAPVTDAVQSAPGVSAASPISFEPGLMQTSVTFVTGVDPVGAPQVLNLEMLEGDVTALERGELLTSEPIARQRNLSVGQDVRVLFSASGLTELRVGGIYAENAYAGFHLLDDQTLSQLSGNEGVWYVYATVAEGADVDQVKASVAEAIADVPNTQVLTRAEFSEWQDAIVDSFLAGIYFMLLFAVVVAVIGVANTIALSVSERVREIGMLRAVGTQRREVARMIRLEAVMTSVAGALVGTVVGLILGVSLRQALEGVGFTVLSIPWVTIGGFFLLAAVAGVLAAYFPARRASRMEVLDALRAL